MEIHDPVIVVRREGDGMICHFWKETMTLEGYAVLVGNLVQHIAMTLDVPIDQVWTLVEREREQPTMSATMAQ